VNLNRGKKVGNGTSGTIVIPRKSPILLHPFIIFSLVWLGVIILYSFHLSKLLLYSTSEAGRVVFYIWMPFALVALVHVPIRKILAAEYPLHRSTEPIKSSILDKQLRVAFRIWMAVTIVEIIVSGGIPIVWLVLGSTKTYRDFGIPSLHGLVNSFLFTIGLCRFALFLTTSEKRHLRVPAFILIWSILVVTRNMMLVSLIQFAILFVRLRPIKMSTVFRFAVAIAGFVLLFGAVGDYRSGSSDLIRKWAQPTDNYPDWLPSGLLWVYIYAATPVNNLIYTIEVSPPLNNPLFPNTSATLFPSVLRGVLYGDQLGEAESGQLIDATFNVSTAYIGPYQDFGLAGIALFSALTAFACLQFWHRKDLKSVLIYVVLAQCLILGLFWNQFLSLPIITQIFWLQVFFRRRSVSKSKVRVDFHNLENSRATL